MKTIIVVALALAVLVTNVAAYLVVKPGIQKQAESMGDDSIDDSLMLEQSQLAEYGKKSLRGMSDDSIDDSLMLEQSQLTVREKKSLRDQPLPPWCSDIPGDNCP